MKLYLRIGLMFFVTLMLSNCASISKNDPLNNKTMDVNPLFVKNQIPDLLGDDFDSEELCYEDEEVDNDPLRPVNFFVLKYVNENAIVYILYPLQQGYKFITPEIAQRGLTNAYGNLDSLFSGVYYIVALRFDYAGLKFSNFLINGVTCLWLCDNFPEDDHLYNIDLADVFKYYKVGKGVFHIIPLSEPTDSRGLVSGLLENQGWATLTSGPTTILFKLFRSITQDDFSMYLEETKRFSVDNNESKYDLFHNMIMNKVE